MVAHGKERSHLLEQHFMQCKMSIALQPTMIICPTKLIEYLLYKYRWNEEMFRTSVTLIVLVSVLVGVMLGLILLEQTNTYDASAKKKSDKQKLREENQRLQDQIDAMKQIKSQNVILPNGSSVAFSQLPPETQRAMLNNSALINANIPTDIGSSSSTHTKHNSDNSNDNPLAEVGRKLKRLFS